MLAELNRKEPVPLRRGDVEDAAVAVAKMTAQFINMISNPNLELFTKKTTGIIERYVDSFMASHVRFNYNYHTVRASAGWFSFNNAEADHFNLNISIAEESFDYTDSDNSAGFVLRVSARKESNGLSYCYEVTPTYIWYD